MKVKSYSQAGDVSVLFLFVGTKHRCSHPVTSFATCDDGVGVVDPLMMITDTLSERKGIRHHC